MKLPQPTEAQTLYFTVPLTPPSVNRYVRHTKAGGHYLTGASEAFKDAVALFARGRKVEAKFYAVTIHIFYAKGERGDLDNRAKLVLDGLVKAQVIHSDAAVTELCMSKHRDPKNPRTEILVESAGCRYVLARSVEDVEAEL